MVGVEGVEPPYHGYRPRALPLSYTPSKSGPIFLRLGAGRHRANDEWSGRLDLNQRSPASKAGGNGHTSLHPDSLSIVKDQQQRSPFYLILDRVSRGKFGAGDRSRTGIIGLEARCSAIELHPQLTGTPLTRYESPARTHAGSPTSSPSGSRTFSNV